MCWDCIMICGCSLEDILLYIYYFIMNKFYIQLFKKIMFDVFCLKFLNDNIDVYILKLYYIICLDY